MWVRVAFLNFSLTLTLYFKWVSWLPRFFQPDTEAVPFEHNIEAPHSEIIMWRSHLTAWNRYKKRIPSTTLHCPLISQHLSLTWSICGHRNIQGTLTFDLSNQHLVAQSIMLLEHSEQYILQTNTKPLPFSSRLKWTHNYICAFPCLTSLTLF